MPDTPTRSVEAAFEALVSALKAAAVERDFDRTAGFLRQIQTLEARWAAGEPAHTVRSPAKKPAAAPAAEPPPPSSPPSLPQAPDDVATVAA